MLSPSDDAGTLAGKGFFRGRPLGFEAGTGTVEVEVVVANNTVLVVVFGGLRFRDHKCGFSTTDLARFSGSILIMFSRSVMTSVLARNQFLLSRPP